MIPKLLRSVALLALVALGGCTFATPFRGPGYDAREGVTIEGTGPVIVAMTKAVLREDRARQSDFWDNVFRVERSLSKQPGLIGYALRRELFGPNTWTMTVWASEASLNAFMIGEIHQTAIREGLPALSSTRFVRFEADREEIPVAWDRAIDILERDGRTYE